MREHAFVKKEIKIGNTIQPIHLGDVLVTLNLLYNRARVLDKEFDVFGPPWIAELFEIFDYCWLRYSGDYKLDKEMNASFLYLMPEIKQGAIAGNKAQSKFLNARFCSLSDNRHLVYKEFQLPKSRLFPTKKENVTYFQFDARSLQDVLNKIPMNKEEMEKTIKKLKFPESEAVGIGGKETKIYIDYPFHLGNLKEISQNLCNCKKFVGVDSGMSHLAGTLKVPTDIINIHIEEPVVSELIQMYEVFYPSIRNNKRNEFFGDKKCKILL